MPIFDYKCRHCGHQCEKLVKNCDTPVECVECTELMDKMISAPNFQLKGNGWYQTDFSGKKKQAGDEPWTRGGSDRFEDIT